MGSRKFELVCKITEKADGNYGVKIPDDYQDSLQDVFRFCANSRGSFVKVMISAPFKARSTGEHSQNHHINGHVSQIAAYTGEDFDVVKDYAKRVAIKRGYPTRETVFGDVIPKSETEIDTVEAGYLIDSLHEIADFLAITLNEGGFM